ncbi:hypothetical protein [Brachybacterium sillae]|nr:hypothetical protein [Brachybacterium sillae]
MPACAYAYELSPEQSKLTPGLEVPHEYETPTWLRAASTIAC